MVTQQLLKAENTRTNLHEIHGSILRYLLSKRSSNTSVVNFTFRMPHLFMLHLWKLWYILIVMSLLVILSKNVTTEKKDWNSIKSHPILRKAFALLPFLFLEELLRLFIAIVVSSKHKSTQVVVSLLFLYSDKYHQYAKTVIALVVGTKNSSGLKINDSSCTSTEFSFGCRFSGSNLFKHSKLLKIELVLEIVERTVPILKKYLLLFRK